MLWEIFISSISAKTSQGVVVKNEGGPEPSEAMSDGLVWRTVARTNGLVPNFAEQGKRS